MWDEVLPAVHLMCIVLINHLHTHLAKPPQVKAGEGYHASWLVRSSTMGRLHIPATSIRVTRCVLVDVHSFKATCFPGIHYW